MQLMRVDLLITQVKYQKFTISKYLFFVLAMMLGTSFARIPSNYSFVNVTNRGCKNNTKKFWNQVPITQQFLKINRERQVCAAEITAEQKSNDVSKTITVNLLGILAGAFGLAWIASVIFPKFVMQNTLNMAVSIEGKSSFIGFVSYFPVMTACLKSLQSAVKNDRLGSDTYRRLNLGLIAMSIGVVANCFESTLWTLPAVSAQASLHMIVLLLAGMNYYKYPYFEVTRELRLFVGSLFQNQKWNSFVYGVLLFACCYGFYILGINTQSYIFQGLNSSVDILMKRSSGVACLLYFMICATLMDAAKRDRLGASTFKNLNIGMFLMSLSTCLNFAWAYKEGALVKQGAFISQEVVTGLAAAFFFSQIFARKKK
eukprot:TRINITY_DN15027_c0_g1_i7.p1 TRINITY_DN15027_c0_g1~~TRINITY_DN15027_c0_g1_i7.p1  ORF type:complete len:372 (-),score=31.04 TRINITY_DN15027_c0_g1_i7:405-1520(-)